MLLVRLKLASPTWVLKWDVAWRGGGVEGTTKPRGGLEFVGAVGRLTLVAGHPAVARFPPAVLDRWGKSGPA